MLTPLPLIERDITEDPTDRACQHWVPDAYLRQWCSPTTPQGAYIWVCPKDRSKPPGRRSPKKTFNSHDMNTMIKEGMRNLRLESIYHSTETSFGIVRAKLISGVQADDSDLSAVVDFIAAQIVRTPKFRSSWQVSARDDHDARLAEISDPETRLAMENTLATIWANRLQFLCLVAYPRVLELLQNLRVRLYKASEPRAFITSDSPCCVIDYADSARSVFESLASRMVNVLMPLSPDVVAILDRSDQPCGMKMIAPGDRVIHRTNSMIWHGAVHEVVLPGETVRSEWFSGDYADQLVRYVAF